MLIKLKYDSSPTRFNFLRNKKFGWINFFKWVFIVPIIMLLGAVILLFTKYLIVMSDKYYVSNNDLFSLGTLFISLMSFFLTALIAVFVLENTQKSTKFSAQRKIIQDVLNYTDDLNDKLKRNLSLYDCGLIVNKALEKLHDFSAESLLFNNKDKFLTALELLINRLNEIDHYLSKFGENFISFEEFKTKKIREYDVEYYSNVHLGKEIKEIKALLYQSIK